MNASINTYTGMLLEAVQKVFGWDEEIQQIPQTVMLVS